VTQDAADEIVKQTCDQVNQEDRGNPNRYAQVVKKKEGGILVNIEKRIIYRNEEDIDYFLISTSHTEQQNLTLRQDNRRLTRETP